MKRLISALIAILVVTTFALAGIYDDYKQQPGDRRWHDKLNAFIDAVGGDIEGVQETVGDWVTTEDYLVFVTTTPSYTDSDTFTLSGDYTAQFTTGAVVLVDLGVDGLKTNTVASSSYGGGTTTVNVNTANITSNITRVWVVATRDGLWPYGLGWYVGRDYGTPGQTALTAVLTAIGSLERTLTLSPGTWTVSTNTTIPANVSLEMTRGAVLDVQTGVTLTINGALKAGPYHIFTETGSGVVSFGKLVPEGYPEWWGNNSNPGSTDMTEEITAAIASGLPKVVFQPYEYNITSTVYIDRGDLHLYGLPGNKISCDNNDAMYDGMLNVKRPATYEGSSLTLSVTADEGDETITLSATTGLAVGDYILVACNYQPHTLGYAGELHKVKDINGSVVTLDRPLHWEYTTGRSSFVKEKYITNENIIFEGLNVEGAGNGSTTQDGDGIRATYCANVLVKNCTVSSLPCQGVSFVFCYNGTVVDSQFYDILEITAGPTYGNGYCVLGMQSHNISVDRIVANRCGKLIDGGCYSNDYGWTSNLRLSNSRINGSMRGGFSTHCGVWDLTVDNVDIDQYTSKECGLRGRRHFINNVRVQGPDSQQSYVSVQPSPEIGSSMEATFVITNCYFEDGGIRVYNSDPANDTYAPYDMVLVQGNTINEHFNAIRVDGYAAIKALSVVDNVINSARGTAIDICNLGTTTLSNVLVANNVINSSYYEAISFEAEGAAITLGNVIGNQIYDHNTGGGSAGIYLFDPYNITNFNIVGNVIRHSGGTHRSIWNNSGTVDTDAGCWISDNLISSSYATKIDGFTPDQIGYNSGYNRPLHGSDTWDPASLNDGTGETKAITVTGAAVGDFVVVSAPYDLQDCTVTAYVQGTNNVEIRLQNESGATRDLGSGTWRVKVIPYKSGT